MSKNLPVPIDLAKNEDLLVAFEIVDGIGAPITLPAGVFSLVLRWRGVSKTITLTPRAGSTNILDAAASLASLSDMPVGQMFLGDLMLVSGGASSVWASLAVTRQEIVQTVDDLGPRTVRVTRANGATLQVVLAAQSGWAPVLAAVSDGARRVLQVADWTGGTGTKPTTGQFVGPLGLVATAAEAVDVRGAAGTNGTNGTNGANGTNGTNGTNGWAPVLAAVSDGARRILQVADWTGGTGSKPASGQYIGPMGLVATAAEAVDISGASVVLSGSGAPSNALGDDGQSYLDTTNARLYGPKASGAWPAAFYQFASAGALAAPSNVVAPTISGFIEPGQTMTVTPGTWSGYPAPTITYQWTLDGADVPSATQTTFIPVPADAGKFLRCRVTATNSSGAPSVTIDAGYVAIAWFDFTRATSIDARITFTRASSAWCFDHRGLLVQVGSGVPRFDHDPVTRARRGLLVEEGRTNIVQWNRDLTNAAWTKTNCNAALSQRGICGGPVTASLLTATGANATCLQSNTLASSARFQTAYVRRVSGSGVIQMTMDGGATWTPITITSSWTRVSIPSQTIADPHIGFRIVTSGDAIAVDFVQNENGTFSTSPILTTSAAVARVGDAPLVSGFSLASWWPGAQGTIVVRGGTNGGSGGAGTLFAWTGSGAQLGLIRALNMGWSQYFARDAAGATQFDMYDTSYALGSVETKALAFAPNDFAAIETGGSVQTDTAGAMPSATNVGIGCGATGLTEANGIIERFVVYPNRIPNSDLPALVAA